MANDKHEDKAMKNIKVLREFRIKGRAVAKGDVIPKENFPKKGDWQNLCNMDPAKAEETSDPVGVAKKPEAPVEPKATKTTKAAKGGLPGATG